MSLKYIRNYYGVPAKRGGPDFIVHPANERVKEGYRNWYKHSAYSGPSHYCLRGPAVDARSTDEA